MMTFEMEYHQTFDKVRNHLESKGITVPSDFEKEAKFNDTEYKGSHLIRIKDVNEVIKIADFWKSAFVSKAEYDKFIINCIYKLYKIQCISINNNPRCEKLYIGGMAKVDENDPLIKAEELITTSLTLYGHSVVKNCSRFKYHF